MVPGVLAGQLLGLVCAVWEGHQRGLPMELEVYTQILRIGARSRGRFLDAVGELNGGGG